MDGNLLDPDNADATLAKEWNLPELPADKSSPLPGSSQELADIFGTSDDEDDMEFPFSLNVGKTFSDLALPDGRETEFFLDSLNSLKTIPPVTVNSDLSSKTPQTPEKTVSHDSKLKGVAGDSKGGNEEAIENESKGVKGDNLGVKGSKKSTETDGVKKEDEVKAGADDADSAKEARSIEELKQSGMTLRKSARLHRNPVSFDLASEQVVKESNNSEPAIESREGGEKKEIKEEDVEKRDLGEEVESKVGGVSEHQGVESKIGGVSEPQGVESSIKEEAKSKGGSTEPEVVAEAEIKSERMGDSDGDDEEGDSESDDPDRLWCICQKPHDDRFMICCDQCEEWYHGSCVGISVTQGKRMEREGKEYICPICVEKEKQAKMERVINRSARVDRRDSLKEKELRKKVDPTGSGGGGRRRSSTGTSGNEGADQYGLSLLFQPDNAPKGGVAPISEEGGEVKVKDTAVRTKFKEEYTGSCIARDCTAPTIPPSVFCGEACIEKHASYAFKKLSERGISFHSTPSEFVRGSGGVSVIEKATGKMLVGIAAPSAKNLVPWLKIHPSYQILLHKKGKGGSSKKKPKLRTEGGGVKKEENVPKFPKISLMDPGSVRANAKRALYQILWKRCEEACDMTNLDQGNVEAIANEIEEKLHDQHGDINPKYKNKYRSLVFNLKDVKNQGLFRKVVLGEVTPWELVRMSTEKLASEELAQWRQKTIKKNIDMIKVREEEAGTLGKVIRKFTYKGDVEIDISDDTKIETINIAEKGSNVVSVEETLTLTTPEVEPVSKSKTRSKSKSHSDSKFSGGGGGGGGILDLLTNSAGTSGVTNTTSQHGSHVYDQNCDICTGKGSSSSVPSPPHQSPEPAPSPQPEPMETETSISPVYEEPMSEELMVHPKQVIWKGFVNMSGLAKFATTAYPVSGPMDSLDELLPDTLHVMGRIAHVQVWDYMDKLRSSTTRDTVVLRFTCVEDEHDAYTSMLTYLVKKHRCGVINCCFPGMKDMYLVPLQSKAAVAPQLLPFQGPGLPQDRTDLLLGLIVRSKMRRTPRLDHSPKIFTTQKITAEVCIKRHHSSSTEDLDTSRPPAKKTRMTVEVGVGGETPPNLGGFQDDDYQELTTPPYNPEEPTTVLEEEEKNELQQLGNVSDTSSPSSVTEQTSQNVHMSFYGEHRPLPDPKPEPQSSSPRSKIHTGTKHGTRPEADVPISISLSTSGNLSAILSQLSDEKLLKDLASAVSTITNKPVSTAISQPHQSNAVPTPVTSKTSHFPDYGANTPPLDDSEESTKSLSRVVGGPPLPRVPGVPTMPLVAGGPPLPRVAGGPPLPRVAGGPPLPRVAGGPPLPRVAGGPPLPRVAGGPPMPHHAPPPPQEVNIYHNRQGLPPPPQQQINNENASEWQRDRDRERFANTPPPDFQPYSQGSQQQAPPSFQTYQTNSNNYKQDPRGQPYPSPPRPHQQQGGPPNYYPSALNQGHIPQDHQQNWDYRGQEDSREYPSNKGGFHRDHGGRGNKYHMSRVTRYPPEWYRK